VSFTGSEKVGRIVGKNVASRFGKSILELGGNNGMYDNFCYSNKPILNLSNSCNYYA
jgi:delta 1-pyrroline-5-carboxylate dehydrogenase